jgi:hypothetical protein
MIQYVITHLGEGVPRQSTYYQTIQKRKDKFRMYFMLLLWDPVRALGSPLRFGVEMPAMQRQLAYREMLRKSEQQAALKSFLQAVTVEQFRQNAMLMEMLRALARESADTIMAKLSDEQPLVRFLAAHAAAHKRLAVEDKLIHLLTDPYPQVREAARQGLVRLSRGNDFGPAPNASSKQIAQSIEGWRLWLRWQEPAAQVVGPEPARPLPDLLGPPQRKED